MANSSSRTTVAFSRRVSVPQVSLTTRVNKSVAPRSCPLRRRQRSLSVNSVALSGADVVFRTRDRSRTRSGRQQGHPRVQGWHASLVPPSSSSSTPTPAFSTRTTVGAPVETKPPRRERCRTMGERERDDSSEVCGQYNSIVKGYNEKRLLLLHSSSPSLLHTHHPPPSSSTDLSSSPSSSPPFPQHSSSLNDFPTQRPSPPSTRRDRASQRTSCAPSRRAAL
jgi:hypothetical protein